MYFAKESEIKARQGFVIGTNGKLPPQPMRLQVTPDTLILQKEEFCYVPNAVENIVPETDSRERKVKVVRQKVGGLGISIKGGTEHKLPILISRITKNQAADHTGQLFVGDAIMKVNGESLEGSSHDDAVNTLRSAGDHVVLTVRHYGGAAPFLMGCLKKHSNEADNIHESPTLRLEEKEQQLIKLEQQSDAMICMNSQTGIKLEKKWVEFISIPLLMAFVTRYIPGTDRLRSNSFEVRSSDQDLKAIIQCDDERSLSEWVGTVASNIAEMMNQQMKAFNKNLMADDQILWMGWVEEGIEMMIDDPPTSINAKYSWHSRFLALKGSELFILDSPPISGKDWSQGNLHVKVYQTALGVLKENECATQRNNCFILQISSGTVYCLAVELANSLSKLETAWHRAIYNAVTKLGSKTFAVVGRAGRSAALTLDWNLGFALYDTEEKNYIWQYRFSQLKGSSDDGKLRLKLHFQSVDTREIETRELESGTLPDLLYCMHAFLTAKVVSVDPNFLAPT